MKLLNKAVALGTAVLAAITLYETIERKIKERKRGS
jgi:hypothetical protein